MGDMKTLLVGIVGFLGLLLASLPGAEDRIHWVSGHAEGRRIARESGRPILVEFR